MKEWTLCADLKVYAGLQSDTKPATHPVPTPPQNRPTDPKPVPG